ncbi:MAG: hypothetical protein ACOCRO_07505 [Halanaerobiales bacterium]
MNILLLILKYIAIFSIPGILSFCAYKTSVEGPVWLSKHFILLRIISIIFLIALGLFTLFILGILIKNPQAVGIFNIYINPTNSFLEYLIRNNRILLFIWCLFSLIGLPAIIWPIYYYNFDFPWIKGKIELKNLDIWRKKKIEVEKLLQKRKEELDERESRLDKREKKIRHFEKEYKDQVDKIKEAIRADVIDQVREELRIEALKESEPQNTINNEIKLFE